MTEKQNEFLKKIMIELTDSIASAERRNKIERKNSLVELKTIIEKTDLSAGQFSVIVDIFNKGFGNNAEWQNYIWQNTTLQSHPDFAFIISLSKKEVI